MRDTNKIASIILFILAIITFLIVIDAPMLYSINQNNDCFFAAPSVGSSMYPTIKNGDNIIIMLKTHPEFNLDIGDILVYNHPGIGAVAHRIYNIKGSNYYVKGDNNEEPDSSSVNMNQIIGKVYYTVDKNNILQNFFVEQFINE